jgi:hypothetical protein
MLALSDSTRSQAPYFPRSPEPVCIVQRGGSRLFFQDASVDRTFDCKRPRVSPATPEDRLC